MRRISIDSTRMAATALIGTLAATAALADPAGGPYYDHYGMMDFGGWGGWIFGPFMMFVFFALLVGAVTLIARLTGGDHLRTSPPREDSALSILRERFARGEISREEFEAARKTLA